DSADRLVNQGLKDSFDSIFHYDGGVAAAQIAPCELQGYVYAAKREAATIAAAAGFDRRAAELNEQAARLQRRFEESFWCAKIGGYALALDGRKRPCCVRTSNPGHCLLSGIISYQHARQLADSFFRADVY